MSSYGLLANLGCRTYLSVTRSVGRNLYKQEHALTLDGNVAAPSMKAVRDTAQDFYRLTRVQADAIEKQVTDVVKEWQDRADHLGMPRFEVQQMTKVFLSGLP